MDNTTTEEKAYAMARGVIAGLSLSNAIISVSKENWALAFIWLLAGAGWVVFTFWPKRKENETNSEQSPPSD